jgi:hypothetical protein
MSAKLWTPGESAQEIFTDGNGNRFDERGNIISGGPDPSLNPGAACYRTERGQVLRYANVYPGPVNVHQNVPLSDFSVAWELDNPGVAAKIAPVHTVSKRSDLFYIIGQQGQEQLRTPTDESDLRAVGAMANEVQDVFNTDTYTVVNRAYRDFLPDEVADNADEVLQLSQHITQFLTGKLEQRWDARVIALLPNASSGFNTQTFATASGGAVKIKDATQASPYVTFALNYIKSKMILANGQVPPTHLVGGLDVCQAMAACGEVRQQIVYDVASAAIRNGGMSPNMLTGGMPDVFNGLNVVCAYNVQNTAKKGQTNSFSALMSNVLYAMHVGTPGRKTLNAITTFRKGGLTTRTYRDEGRRGMYIEVEMIQTEKVTNAYGGQEITACIS